MALVHVICRFVDDVVTLLSMVKYIYFYVSIFMFSTVFAIVMLYFKYTFDRVPPTDNPDMATCLLLPCHLRVRVPSCSHEDH